MQMIRQAVSRNGLTLGLFAVVTLGMVILAANLTEDAIANAMAETLKNSLYEVMPRERLNNDLLADRINLEANELLGTKSSSFAWVARKDAQPVGVILQVVAPEGYGGAINLLVGVDVNGIVTGVRVIPPHFETPGLGDKIEIKKSPWILDFNEKSLLNTTEEQWQVSKDGGEFDAFTGATITPRTVVDAVYKSLQYFDAHKQTLLGANSQTHKETGHVGH